MRRLLATFFLAAATIWSHAPARSYTLQFTDASNMIQVRWRSHTITVALSSSLSSPQPNIKMGSDPLRAARKALRRWSEEASIRFIEITSDAQAISASGARGDGLSLITVAHTPENAAPFNGGGQELSARTRIFSTITGRITEADIALNPSQFFSDDGTPGTYDLEATFTHEIGHLLGLEHSGVLGATMQPRQGKNGIYNLPSWSMRSLSDDDRAGVRAIYGARPRFRRERGTIAGTITFASGAPVFGANVWAEDVLTGRVGAGNITLMNGAYRIDGLPTGAYRVIAQALDGTTVAPAEIASQRGAYAGLAVNPLLPFRTEEIGRVVVTAGATSTLNAQLSGSQALLSASFIGLNDQLSTIAVPLAAGGRYKVFIAGVGINANLIPKTGITTTSPFIVVDRESVAASEFGNQLSVISFTIAVDSAAPAGEYSLRLQSLTGEVTYVAGGLTIDSSETVSLEDSEQNETLIAETAASDSGFWTIGAGSISAMLGSSADENGATEARVGVINSHAEQAADTLLATPEDSGALSAPSP